MHEPERERTTLEEDDSQLEHNISALLDRAHRPPRLDSPARERILARLIDESSSQPPTSAPRTYTIHVSRRRNWRAVLAGASALAAVVALLWLAWSWSTPMASVPAPALHENSGLFAQEIHLGDGSTVALRGGAAIEEVDHRRIRLLRGDALLDVAKGDGPFVVESPHGRAVVLGTKFILSSNAERTEAAVLRGTVRLESAAGEELLRAGQRGSIASEGTPLLHDGGRISHDLGWARDLLRTSAESDDPVRRGNLIARNPRWSGEWPLPMRALAIDVHVEDGVARTTLDQTYFNHTFAQLEGVYEFPLPSGAAISRLGMYVDGKLMEGGIVERQHGREVYESIVNRRQDPALLEWMGGNTFRARVFPLPPRSEKRLFVSYTQELEEVYGERRLRVPMPELDLPVGELRLRVHVADGGDVDIESQSHPLAVERRGDLIEASWQAKEVELGADFVVALRPRPGLDLPEVEVRRSAAADALGYQLIRVRPDLPAESAHEPRRWVALVDTSASRSSRELRAQGELLTHLLHEFDEDDTFALIAFDTTQRRFAPTMQRIGDIDGAQLKDFVASEALDPVGETDLDGALASALAILDEHASETSMPHILYLGDGRTDLAGPAATDLSARLVGRATLVAIALGDHVDAAFLRRLADATGGLHEEIEVGADLAWEALDLVARLNSPRVVDVKATLLDGDGNALDLEDAQLSSTVLGHGETISVLSRSARDAAESIRLDGKLRRIGGGDSTLEPWSHSAVLPPATSEARYLARQWAQARVGELLSDDAEQNHDEIVELGMTNFLITPFTSLLVLENDAMYERFAVRRPPSDGWARYDAPPTIPVRYEPVRSLEAAAGTHLVREPLPVLQSPVSSGADVADAFRRAEARGGPPGGAYAAEWSGGLLLRGTAVGESWGLGGLGLIGSGRGGGGSGKGVVGLGAVASDAIWAGPVSGATDSAGGVSSPATTVARTSDLANSSPGWSYRSSSVRPSPSSLAGFGGRGHRGATRGGFVPWNYGTPTHWPLRYHHSMDASYADLSEWIPALFEGDYDLARERLLESAAALPHGSITAAARARIDSLRASQRSIRYVEREQTDSQLFVAADGRFVIDTRHGGHLTERIIYDGEDLISVYDQFELVVRRHIGLTEPALIWQYTPWVMPSADALVRWFEISVSDAGDLVLHDPSRSEDRILRIDGDRIVAIELQRAGVRTELMRFERDDGSLTVAAGGERRVLVAQEVDFPQGIAPDVNWTVVDMPLRDDAHWQAQLATLVPGSAPWLAIQEQRIAGYAATARPDLVAGVLGDLAATSTKLRLGTRVLASGSVLVAPDSAWSPPVASSGGVDPVDAHLAVTRDSGRRGRPSGMDELARAATGTTVGMLALHRAALRQIESPTGSKRSVAIIREFLVRYDEPELAYVLVDRLDAHHRWRRPELVAGVWSTLADRHPQWAVEAHYRSGIARMGRGGSAAAAPSFERMFAASQARGEAPRIDWSVRASLQAIGNATWNRAWSGFRRRALATGDARLLVALVAAAAAMGETNDLRLAIRALQAVDLAPEEGLLVLDLLASQAMEVEARELAGNLLARYPKHPGLLLEASAIAERQGRLAEAIDLHERALALALDSGDEVATFDLEGLRSAHRRLFELERRLHHAEVPMRGESPVMPVRALRVAARWRVLDPDNDEVSILAAHLLQESDFEEEAWRHLSSIAERHPAEGEAYARIARELERLGAFDRAAVRWRRAFEVEPTNPRWLIGAAENALARADTAAASELLDGVLRRTWQDRFADAVHQARALRATLD